MRARIFLVTALAAALVLGACGTKSTSAHTRVLVFAPFASASSGSRPSVTATASGSCWEGSLALFQNATAWRCTTGNQIMDPCFGPPHQPNTTEVVCVTSPWSPATRLNLTQPLPLDQANSPGNGPKAVWAVELANHDHCLIGTGTAPQAGSVVLQYTCTSGSFAGALDRDHEPWTVQYRSGNSGPLRPLAVLTAWDS